MTRWQVLRRRIRARLAPARPWLGLRVALALAMLLGLVALSLVQSGIRQQEALATLGCARPPAPGCPAVPGAPSMALELAGQGQALACQLRSQPAAASPTVAERICIEARVQARWDELARLDARVFMPLYAVLTLLVAAWTGLHGRAGPARWQAPAVLGLAVLLLLAADMRENRAAQALLVRLEATGAFDPGNLHLLDADAYLARQRSLLKWALAAGWMLALAWSLWRWQVEDGWWWKALRRLAIGAAVLGGALLGAGTVLGLADKDAMAAPVQALAAGFTLAFLVFPAVALVAWRQRSTR